MNQLQFTDGKWFILMRSTVVYMLLSCVSCIKTLDRKTAPTRSPQRRIDCRQMHLSLVFMPMILMKVSLHCGGDLHLKSHFYEGQGNLFLEG